MNARYLLASGLVLASAGQAFPQAGVPEYFIVKTPDQKCTVVDQKPRSASAVVVGDRVYYSRTDAETAMKKVCTD